MGRWGEGGGSAVCLDLTLYREGRGGGGPLSVLTLYGEGREGRGGGGVRCLS